MKDLDKASLCLVLRFTEIGLVVYQVYLERPKLVMGLKVLY